MQKCSHTPLSNTVLSSWKFSQLETVEIGADLFRGLLVFIQVSGELEFMIRKRNKQYIYALCSEYLEFYHAGLHFLAAVNTFQINRLLGYKKWTI